ncbi:unnamed protein product [Paramecium primaurelia]|uniref:Transmembrane protein n=1 Tax=Paramecium primaurelia TaxID=5886 RepID=A0A8S1PUX4_PARPR|nr:unnamed protein product [Paramecium primaurelia]CAD8107112.1 unnamed protein product [Paramecium primaurelia]
MNNFSQIMSTIFYLSTLTLAQNLIQIGNLCTCEQLTSQFDCSYFSKCQFIDQVCSQKSCDQMNFEACQSSDCAWNNGKCSKFTNCQDYQVSIDEDCFNLKHDCVYNHLTKTCQTQDPLKKSCQEQDQANCYYGIEGKCIYKDNQCQIWINCEDGEQQHCMYGNLHCMWNIQQNKCVSVPSCQQIEDQLCLFAFPYMNSMDAYICQYDKNGNCQDFDISNSNSESCISQSYGYYQWKNGKCIACQSINFDLISSALVLTILFLS